MLFVGVLSRMMARVQRLWCTRLGGVPAAETESVQFSDKTDETGMRRVG